MMRRGAVLSALALWTAVTAAADWAPDPSRSTLGFVASYDRVPFETRFERFAAAVHFDPARPAEGRIEVTIETASVNSRSADRDEGMQGAEWFDSAKFPTARFASSRIAAAGDGRFRMNGTLTIKDITRAVEIPFRWTQSDGAARLAGEAAVRRTDFDVGTGDWKTDDTIGFDVRIVFDLQLARK
jgi:polyisoprenoid-binding protein YceI